MIKKNSICSRDYYIGLHQNRLAMTRETFHIPASTSVAVHQPALLPAGLFVSFLNDRLFPEICFLSMGSTYLANPRFNF